MMRILRQVACVLLTVLAANRSCGASPAQDPAIDASVAMIRQAVTPQRDDSHLALLFALRQLHDPALKPLFYQLAQSATWQVQVHAVIGLAEITEERQVDPWLISQVQPKAQEAAIATALDLELLAEPQLQALLAIETVQGMARGFVLAELASMGRSVEPAELAALGEDGDVFAAALGAALLAQAGQPEAMAQFEQRLQTMPAHERDAVIGWLADAIRRYRLTANTAFLKRLLAAPETGDELRYRALLGLIELEPEAGLSQWREELAAGAGYSRRVRHGLLLLAAAERATPELFDLLAPQDDEALLQHIVMAGKAIAAKKDVTPALIALLDLNHIKTTSWALDYLSKMPPEQAVEVLGHLIDRVGSSKAAPGQTDRIAIAVQATSSLFKIDPEQVISRLKAAVDGELQEAILLGLFQVDSPRIGEAAAEIPRGGAGRADSLALMLMARYRDTLNDADLNRLGMIASGGGRVSEILRVQAAWLYLKHRGQVEAALASAFARETNGE